MVEEKKVHRGEHCLRYEPENVKAIIEYQIVMEAFSKAGCLWFCEKLQGCHTQVSKEFSLHFSGTNTKIGMLNVLVTPEIIAFVTKIPRGKENWFKGFKFDMEPCKEFMKPEYADMDMNNAIPRSCIKDTYAKLLFNIQDTLHVKVDTIKFILIILSCFYISQV